MRFHRTVLGGQEISAGVRGLLDHEADKLQVSFYVDTHNEDDDKEHLHFAHGSPKLDEDAMKRLRELATENNLNIYVHKPDYSNESFSNAIDMGPSSKR